MAQIYANLRAEMARKKVTVKDLAEALNISTVSMSKRLNGHLNFKLPEAKAAARYLCKDFDYLFKD